MLVYSNLFKTDGRYLCKFFNNSIEIYIEKFSQLTVLLGYSVFLSSL